MDIKKHSNWLQKIKSLQKSSNRYNILLLLILTIFSSCAVKSESEEVFLQYDAPIVAKKMWSKFVNDNPPLFSPFRMEQTIKIKTASSSYPTLKAHSWGNAKGISRMDVLTPFRTPLLKAREGLLESTVYIIPQNTVYTCNVKDYAKLLSGIGLEMPFTLQDFFTILTGNASLVYSKYYTTFSKKDGIMFILTPGDSQNSQSLYISYDNKHISWQDSTGWKIEYTLNNGRIVGLLAQHKKGYSLASTVTKLEHNYPVTEDNLIIRFPKNARIQHLK